MSATVNKAGVHGSIIMHCQSLSLCYLDMGHDSRCTGLRVQGSPNRHRYGISCLLYS